MRPAPSIVVVAGATASGKSEFAENLALEIGGEILNADSQQFYKGFDIGTGKVPPGQRRSPHWLLDLCRPGERMTAMEFVRHAEAAIADVSARGRVPVLVGGTGLYLKALLEGLDEMPPRHPEIRAKLQEEAQVLGAPALHSRLQEIDPVSAAKISPQDPLRIIRYLEISMAAGRPASELMRGERPAELRFPTRTHWLRPERSVLAQRIAERVEAMFRAGWMEEVRLLQEQGFDPRVLENRPIGYVEVADALAGLRSVEDAKAEIIFRTRQYAKRQETFFRGMFSHPAYDAVIHSQFPDI
ncbi:MAG: tRNA (adenosine(37)-N6)-dimethylallyltransferase MiaA [Deltaproteobacteria bacterium]|nr:tRNA (adenosine(37)-N6)-dimethylallyltransferase MiaA [Deltaproteobacteria bacterium]